MLLLRGDGLPIVIVRPSIGKFQLTLDQGIVIYCTWYYDNTSPISNHALHLIICFYLFFYLLHILLFFFLYEHSYGIVERTNIRMGRQFKWADGSAGWRRQRGSEDTAVSQGLDCWPGPSRYMYQLINIGCLVHGHQ